MASNANPALPGELRWFATVDGKDIEVAGPEAFTHGTRPDGTPREHDPYAHMR